MSEVLNKAIYRRLAGVETLSGVYATAQANLAALLGVDPDTGLPAVYYSSTNQAQGVDTGNVVPVYPKLTFWETGGMPHHTSTISDGITVDWVFMDFSVWVDRVQTPAKTGKSPSQVVSEVSDILKTLLDIRLHAPLLPLQTGCVDIQMIMTPLHVIPRGKTHEIQGYLRWKFLEKQTFGASVVV